MRMLLTKARHPIIRKRISLFSVNALTFTSHRTPDQDCILRRYGIAISRPVLAPMDCS